MRDIPRADQQTRLVPLVIPEGIHGELEGPNASFPVSSKERERRDRLQRIRMVGVMGHGALHGRYCSS